MKSSEKEKPKTTFNTQIASSELPYTVYAIRCSITGRIYIGVTANVERRIKQHYKELVTEWKRTYVYGQKEYEPSLWQLDFNKYGKYVFGVYILESEIPYKRRLEREQFWIDEYMAYDPRYGYNTYGRPPCSFEILNGKPPKPHHEYQKHNNNLKKYVDEE